MYSVTLHNVFIFKLLMLSYKQIKLTVLNVIVSKLLMILKNVVGGISFNSLKIKCC